MTLKIYEYGDYGDNTENMVIKPGSTRLAWVNYVTLPDNGTYFLEYEIKEGTYTTKSKSANLVLIKNTGDEDLVLYFCRRFKK